MNTVSLPQHCNECGQQIAKAHRVYKGGRYCAVCYSRIFKRRICPKCGRVARLLTSDPAAVCRTCEHGRPCVRCGNIGSPIGKITIYGPVCNACSPYFRQPSPCEACGVLSLRLTRLSRLGHERHVCPKCARADYGTCQACTRYRLLRGHPDGRMLCKTCLDKGEVACPKCQKLMPAGYGRHCQYCYWLDLLEKRIQMDCFAFSVARMATHFEAFGHWLKDLIGEHKAALTIHRYLPFFMEVERTWQDFPKFEVLLMHFGTAKLRRVLLPMRWMEAIGLIMSNAEAKAYDSESRRITNILEIFAKGVKARSILEGYHSTLMNNVNTGKMTLHSVRLALSPAAALLCKADEMGNIIPNQKDLDIYLAKTPGQRNAISRFVRYLRERHCAEIELPKVALGSAQRQRRKKLEGELLFMMKNGCGSNDLKQRWLSVSLAYFHGLNRKVGFIIKHESVNQSDYGLVVTWNNELYWLPMYPK